MSSNTSERTRTRPRTRRMLSAGAGLSRRILRPSTASSRGGSNDKRLSRRASSSSFSNDYLNSGNFSLPCTEASGEFSLGSNSDDGASLPTDISQQCSPVIRPQSSIGGPRKNLEGLSINKLRFQNLGRLFGRDKEIDSLTRTYEKMRAERRRELIWVSGDSGTGKTALVSQLEETVRRAGGLFLVGKFDQQHRVDPFVGFAQAFSNLGEAIKKSEKLRTEIFEEVGEEIKLIAEIIPCLAEVYALLATTENEEEKEEEEEAGFVGAHNRLTYAFRRFVRAVASCGPLVISLDDLQWADFGSLNLIESLIGDFENSFGILIIGTYRSNEVDNMHALTKRMQSIEELSNEEKNVTITNIPLCNIDESTVNELLSELLSMELHKTAGLARIIHRKTYGNVFFVIEFLKTLVKSKQLEYNLGILMWTWDEGAIEQSTSIASNVVDLMRNKLKGSAVGSILPIVACLGASFDEKKLSQIVARSMANRDATNITTTNILMPLHRTDCWIETCVEEGFLERYGRSSSWYRFVHDSIQEAAFSLIPEHRRASFRYKLGLVLWRHLDEDELDSMIFSVTDLLNQGVGVVDEAEKIRIASINLRAGKKAASKSAFACANMYLKKGIETLPKDHWKTEYKLSLNLFVAAAETSHNCGKYQELKSLCYAILAQPHCPLTDQLPVYSILVEGLNAHGRGQDSIAMSRRVLAQLGCKFSKRFETLAVGAELIKTKRMLKRYSHEDLMNLPVLVDPEKKLMIELLYKQARSCYIAHEVNLLLLSFLRLVQYALKYGVSGLSASSFAGYGFILTVALGDLKGGTFYCGVALDLLRKFRARAMASRTCMISHIFVLHWTTTPQRMLHAFLEGYQTGMAMGEVFDAAALLNQYLACAVNAGRPLGSLDADFQAACRQLQEYQQTASITTLVIVWQYILNLMGESQETCILEGRARKQDKARFQKEEGDLQMDGGDLDNLRAVYGHVYQLRLAYYFGDYELAMEMVYKCQEKIAANTMTGQLPLIPTAFFSGLTCLAKARETRHQSKYKRLANRFTKQLKTWSKKGCPNCQHLLLLLKAEVLSFDKKREVEAQKCYELAILFSGRQGLIHDRALANELLGSFHLGRKISDSSDDSSSHYLGEAQKLYLEWGAAAKAKQLEQKYPEQLCTLWRGRDTTYCKVVV